MDSCTNGYPSEDRKTCILRDSAGYPGVGGDLTQQVDPIGPNCEVGTRGNEIFCLICKPGFVVIGDPLFSFDRACAPITTQPKNCLLANNQGRCIYCNFYYGYLPVDDQVTACYKFGESIAESQSLAIL